MNKSTPLMRHNARGSIADITVAETNATTAYSIAPPDHAGMVTYKLWSVPVDCGAVKASNAGAPRALRHSIPGPHSIA
eukprot:2637687-Amphidinium_carterae.2